MTNKKCEHCDGVGYYADHDPLCDGKCRNCPVQMKCVHCHEPNSEADKLREALRNYGRHTEKCEKYDYFGIWNDDGDCTCGFDEALKEDGK